MKKVLKVVGLVVGLVVVVVGGFVGYCAVDGIPSYPIEKVEFKVVSTPEKVAVGKKWVTMLCAQCHMNAETGTVAGRLFVDLPPEFGKVWVRNITQDKKYGIADYTDSEIAYLLRTGIKRDGKYAPPWMAKLPHLSDETIEGIIAFLRSDDPLVKATPVEDFDAEPTLLTKILSHTVFKPLPYPKSKIVAPALTDKVAYGKYLVASLDCYGCHSADFKTMNVMEPEKSEGFMAGGNMIVNYDLSQAFSTNITPDPETGIGKWTEDDFARALRNGLRPDKTLIRPPMAMFNDLTDEEAKAIFAYLKTVPPIKKENKPWGAKAPAPVATADAGGKLYHKYGCTACHGENGVGMCDLTKATDKYPEDEKLIGWIKDPQKIAPGSKMPTWEGIIPEPEFPVLAKYVRELGTKAKTAGGGGKPGGP